ncbi:MAG: hypothetical protein AAFO99_12855, partial [Bacteroidota bacterium]
MPEIPDKSEFEPNANALSQWLSTRKPTYQVGGTSVPGFFGDTRNDVDLNWTLVALAGELIGMVLTIYGGATIGGTFLIISILVVLGLLFIDVLSAIKLHRNKARKCQIDNYIFLYHDEKPKERKQLELEQKGWKFVDFCFVVLIIFVILVKIAAIVALGIFSNEFVYLPVLAIYIVVGYVHVYHTGYWIAYWKTSKMFRKQYDSSGINTQERSHPFSMEHELTNVPIERENFKVVQDDTAAKEEGKFAYRLHTNGVLTDKDI